MSDLSKSNTSKYAYTSIFEEVYVAPSSYSKDSISKIYTINMGKIKILSGKIIACDPAYIYGCKPFDLDFPKGEFEVDLSIAKIDGVERIAYSRILFSSNPVAKWEFALLPGQTRNSIGGKNFYSFGVDSGMGLFIDESGKDTLFQNENYEKEFIDELEKTYKPVRDYTIYSFGNYNLAAFSSGYGDGRYAAYVGYDNNGKICRLLIDFNLFQWQK